jgi:hypothetical protein
VRDLATNAEKAAYTVTALFRTQCEVRSWCKLDPVLKSPDVSA